MQYTTRIIYLALTLVAASLWLSPTTYAMTFPTKPVGSFYVDDAHLINANAAKEINQIASQLWEEHHISILVVTIPSLLAENASKTKIEDYAKSLFEYWDIGGKKNSNGILLLISKEDRQSRITLGAGWGRNYDTQATDIMNDSIITELKNDHFSAGILKGLHGLDALARQSPIANAESSSSWMTPLAFIAGILVFTGLFSWFRNGRYGWAWTYSSRIVFFILRKLHIGGGRFDE